MSLSPDQSALEAGLDAAIVRGDLDAAWPLAEQLSAVTLDRALRLTMLAGRWRRNDYDQIVRAFLERFIRECAPSPEAIKKTADALAVIGNPSELWISDYAWKGMADLAGQIKRREVRLGRPFFERPGGDW